MGIPGSPWNFITGSPWNPIIIIIICVWSFLFKACLGHPWKYAVACASSWTQNAHVWERGEAPQYWADGCDCTTCNYEGVRQQFVLNSMLCQNTSSSREYKLEVLKACTGIMRTQKAKRCHHTRTPTGMCSGAGASARAVRGFPDQEKEYR